jgi:uncharacterized membrane protein YdjX (TVP38/TMEM64 family)
MYPEKVKRNIRIAWICLLAACLGTYFLAASHFTPQAIAAFLEQYQGEVFVVYFILCLLRGITLIPATPFLFAGIILFPNRPFLLLGAFLLSLFLIAVFLYRAARYIGMGPRFLGKHKNRIDKIKRKMNGRAGFWFILLWAFAPFTPTDLISYVAGSLKMRFTRFIIPLISGEALICSIYVFNGTALVRHYF